MRCRPERTSRNTHQPKGPQKDMANVQSNCLTTDLRAFWKSLYTTWNVICGWHLRSTANCKRTYWTERLWINELQKWTPDVPVYNMQGQVLFRLQVDKKTLQVKTLRRGTGFQPTDRRFGVRMGQQTRPHAISLQQSNGLRMETLQIPRRLLIGHRNLPRGQIVNPRLKDHKVPHEKIPRHPQKRHLHGW